MDFCVPVTMLKSSAPVGTHTNERESREGCVFILGEKTTESTHFYVSIFWVVFIGVMEHLHVLDLWAASFHWAYY